VKYIFYKAPKGYEDALAPAIISGAAACGDEIILKKTEEYDGPEADGAVLIGVVKREILWGYRAAGKRVWYFDKGYTRSRAPFADKSLPEWWRICIDGTHPTEYLMRIQRPHDRLALMNVPISEKRNFGKRIVILGSSAKFHLTHRITEPTEWTRDLIGVIRDFSDRPITYRPKPSWKYAVPVEGARFDHGSKTPVSSVLGDAWCTVTYGSIASVDSILAGVPCIVLGNAVAAPLCSDSIADIEHPLWADLPTRKQWLANLAYCQWRPQEIASGLAWRTTKETADEFV